MLSMTSVRVVEVQQNKLVYLEVGFKLRQPAIPQD